MINTYLLFVDEGKGLAIRVHECLMPWMKEVNSFDVVEVCSIVLDDEDHIAIAGNSIVVEDRTPTMHLSDFEDGNLKVFFDELKGNDFVHIWYYLWSN